jgi:hypothetical protein
MRWISEEDEALRLAYGRLPTAEIARLLERSENCVGKRARKLGLDSGRYWTPAEDAQLRNRYPHELTVGIARDMGRSERSVYQRAMHMGLKKGPRARAKQSEFARHQAMTDPRIIAGRIKPGTTPPNKGLRRPGWAPGRMAETQFKKGGMSGAAQHNYVPVGTLRIDHTNGYLERKVTDDHPVPARRWVAVHRLVWETAHGAIPPGHRVAFKPGMKTNVLEEITLDKLELVTPAEMMRRNTRHNLPEELNQAIQAKACLTRVINRATRGERNV